MLNTHGAAFSSLKIGSDRARPFWRIFSKAGLAKQLSILMLVPLLNLGVLYYLAFTDWPSLNNSK
jgi:hypothetical protein